MTETLINVPFIAKEKDNYFIELNNEQSEVDSQIKLYVLDNFNGRLGMLKESKNTFSPNSPFRHSVTLESTKYNWSSSLKSQPANLKLIIL